MADTHQQFQTYHETIRLKKNKRDSLKASRDANRQRIRDHFKDVLKCPVPKFHEQGSYAMHTGVEPLSGDYDVDDGVYLQGLGTDRGQWPASGTVHGWIVDAVKGYTSEPPQDKARCVRVRYATDYHVDLPSYVFDANDFPQIFEKGKETYESDPRAFTKWWKQQVKGCPQLRQILRYLKGWRDFQKALGSTASGVALTILAVNHYVARDRDDQALVDTAAAIYWHLYLGGTVCKPVSPYEDLSARWKSTERDAFVAKLKDLKDSGQDALDEEELSVATDIWRQLLGDRFPKVEAQDKAKKTSAPAIIGNDRRSA